MKTLIGTTEIDLSILDRISHEDITMWFAAQVQRSQSLIPTTRLCFDYSADYGGAFTMHAQGECVVSEVTVADAVQHLQSALYDNAEQKAAAKRAVAEKLIQEAQHLEQLAKKGVGTP